MQLSKGIKEVFITSSKTINHKKLKLFKSKSNSLEDVDSIPFQKERDIQNLIENNVNTVFGLAMIKSEFSVGNYRIDTLCYDEERNSFVIVEYKKGSSYSVIDQGFSYYQLMLNNKSDFILVLSQHLGKVLSVKDIDWGESRIIFISPSFNTYQKDSVNFKNLPFELWEIKRYSNDTIVLNQHKSNSKEEIQSLNGTGQDIINEVKKEVKSYTFEEHYQKTNDEALEKYIQLKELLEELGDVEFGSKKMYISLLYQNTTIAYFNFQKQRMRIDVMRGNENVDGTFSKKFFELDDPKSISKSGSWVWKTGVKGHYYHISLDSSSDVDYLMFLLKQKYSSLKN